MVFKHQAAWESAELAYKRFSYQYDKSHAGEWFDCQQFESEWEKTGVLTPCRKCGVTLDTFDGSEAFSSDDVLLPMFAPTHPNGQRTGQRFRFCSESEVGLSGFCESCCHELVPWFQKLADVCEVMKIVNYLERSIRCQRNNNPVEKSKLLANLGRCLSTQPLGY